MVEQFSVVIFPKEKMVGCPILQAAYGGNNHLVSTLFDSDLWVVSPKSGSVMVKGNWDQWNKLAQKWNKHDR